MAMLLTAVSALAQATSPATKSTASPVKPPPAAVKALPAAPLAPFAPFAPVQASQPNRFVVVLDAAHGGDDVGAQLSAGGGTDSEKTVFEKTLTLALSVRLRSLLTARGFQVVTTREGNATLDLDARAQVANHAAAAACLSLHVSPTGSGVHVFVSSLSPTGQTRFLAWKTAQSAYVTRSLKLASMVNSALEHSGDAAAGSDGNAAPGAIPVTLARTSLPGVDSMACPALAVEVAPIRGSDRGILTNVTDAQYQAQLVEALAAALLEWRTELQGDKPGDARNGVKQP